MTHHKQYGPVRKRGINKAALRQIRLRAGRKEHQEKLRRERLKSPLMCEVVSMHEDVKGRCAQRRLGPGTEGYSLMCSLGNIMGNGDLGKVRMEEVRQRYRAFVRNFESGRWE